MHPALLATGVAMTKRAPTADEVAAALVTACRHTGEDPIRLAMRQALVSQAALHAISALAPLFDLPYPRLAALCGLPHLKPRGLAIAQASPTWSRALVRAIQEAVLAVALQARPFPAERPVP